MLILLVLIIPLAYSISSSSTNFNQTSSVIDTGGGNSTSSSFDTSFTIGESIVGNSTSSSFRNILGFYQAFNNPPEAPILQYPSDGAVIIDRTPTFNWSIPSDLDGNKLHFRIQIANDSIFENITLDLSSKDNTTGFNPTPPVPEGAGTQFYTQQINLDFKTYYWRVAAIDPYEQGHYSTVFNFTVLTSVVCSLSNSEIDFGLINPGDIVNASLNYAGTGNGTKYNITTTSNIDVNITHKGENLTCQSPTCGDDIVPVQNISWQSNITSANGTNMKYINGIDLQPDYDTTNPIATDFPPSSTVHLRYWLRTRYNQGGGNYNGTYTIKCEQS